MKEHFVTEKDVKAFIQYLREEEKEAATIEKYNREVQVFYVWLQGRAVTKEVVLEWKVNLQKEGYAPGTVNGKLSALNGFFRFMRWEECRVKFLRIQRQMFRQQSKELTRAEYARLLDTAHRTGKERLELMMETICAAGIRVSELSYITVEAARMGRAEVALKGKIRVILLSDKLCRETKERFGRNFCHKQWERPFQKADLERNERTMRGDRGRELESIPTQSQTFVRHNIL